MVAKTLKKHIFLFTTLRIRELLCDFFPPRVFLKAMMFWYIILFKCLLTTSIPASQQPCVDRMFATPVLKEESSHLKKRGWGGGTVYN